MLTESRQVATPSISSSLSRSCWIAVPSRASRPCNSKLFSCNSDHQNFSFAQKKSIEGEMFSPPGGGDQKQIPRQRCSPTAATSSPRAFWVVFSLMFRSTSSFQTHLTRALKSSLRFSCSTASSFNSLRVASKADSA